MSVGRFATQPHAVACQQTSAGKCTGSNRSEVMHRKHTTSIQRLGDCVPSEKPEAAQCQPASASGPLEERPVAALGHIGRAQLSAACSQHRRNVSCSQYRTVSWRIQRSGHCVGSPSPSCSACSSCSLCPSSLPPCNWTTASPCCCWPSCISSLRMPIRHALLSCCSRPAVASSGRAKGAAHACDQQHGRLTVLSLDFTRLGFETGEAHFVLARACAHSSNGTIPRRVIAVPYAVRRRAVSLCRVCWPPFASLHPCATLHLSLI